MARNAYADINLQAIIDNCRLAKQISYPANIVAIIKANAYGHGAIKVATSLEPEVGAFGVSCIEEALELRESGIKKPIVLLEGFFEANELSIIEKLNLYPVIHSKYQLLELGKRLEETKMPYKIWVKIDTGLHRLGFYPEDINFIISELKKFNCIQDITLMSHFSSADIINGEITKKQIEIFENSTRNFNFSASLANSAGIMAWPKSRKQWVRPGIMLYGISPFNTPYEIAEKLSPAMSLNSHIISIRDVAPNETIGYSSGFRCKKRYRVGTVAMGYADGYPRYACNGTPVMVNGRRTCIIGNVSMDMLTIDLTDLPEINIGDKVEFWGGQLSVTEVAKCCNTIPYTLLTGISSRIARRYF